VTNFFLDSIDSSSLSPFLSRMGNEHALGRRTGSCNIIALCYLHSTKNASRSFSVGRCKVSREVSVHKRIPKFFEPSTSTQTQSSTFLQLHSISTHERTPDEEVMPQRRVHQVSPTHWPYLLPRNNKPAQRYESALYD